MKKLTFFIPVLALLVTGCETANSPAKSNVSAVPGDTVANTGMFPMKPILPQPGTDYGPTAWNVSTLPKSVGTINPVPNNDKWQPMNFGEDAPLIAGSDSGPQYMATDAGVWYRHGQRWTFMPGTERLTPIAAITITSSGAPIIATPRQILAYESKRWVRISDKQLPGEVNSLRWTKNGELAALVTVYPQQKPSTGLGGPAPIPVPGMMVFDGKKWRKADPRTEARNLINRTFQGNIPGVQAMGVHYIGLSPTGIPTMELMENHTQRSIWQYIQGQWKELNMSGFPVDKFGLGSYFETQDVTWWNHQLIVSSPTGGAMGWSGSTWSPVGNNRGMTSNYHRMGTIASSVGNALFAEVKESVPAPPTTPSREFNTLWEFQKDQWRQLALPNPSPGNVLSDPVVSSAGAVAVSESDSWQGNHIWLYRNQKWQEISNGTGLFTNDHVRELKFLPDGKLTIQLVGSPASANNIYEWTGTKWVPFLTNNAAVNQRDTYWFNYTWAPDGSIIVGLMNVRGYSVWRYDHGKWTNLGLVSQRPEFLYVTKQNTLFVVTDKYVCWKLNLS